MPTEDREDARSLDVRLDSLFAAMENYEIVKIHDEIEAIQVLASHMGSKFTVRNLGMYIMLKLDAHLHTMHEDLFRMLGIELKNLDVLLQFETMDDIFSWLRMKVFEISERLNFRKPNGILNIS